MGVHNSAADRRADPTPTLTVDVSLYGLQRWREDEGKARTAGSDSDELRCYMDHLVRLLLHIVSPPLLFPNTPQEDRLYWERSDELLQSLSITNPSLCLVQAALIPAAQAMYVRSYLLTLYSWH